MNKSLDEARRELERQEAGGPEVYVCEIHGEHEHLVCNPCYAIQQERVERESADLRVMNTTESNRRWVLETLATRNGHG